MGFKMKGFSGFKNSPIKFTVGGGGLMYGAIAGLTGAGLGLGIKALIDRKNEKKNQDEGGTIAKKSRPKI